MDSKESIAGEATNSVPPITWFVVSAIFRYLGPSFAVLLFPAVGVVGIAWLRISTAALAFSLWTRPWRVFRESDQEVRVLLLALGGCFALMNSAFYLALDRLPISLVASIEFVGTIGLALYGTRTTRNIAAIVLAGVGVCLIIDMSWADDPLGLFWAVLNGALFVCYIALGYKISEAGVSTGTDRVAAGMFIAFLLMFPIGLGSAAPALTDLTLLAAGAGVGICSSVIPYICDQLAMASFSRESFALLLALLPAIATIIGVIVLRQIPTLLDMAGLMLVMAGIAIHVPAARIRT